MFNSCSVWKSIDKTKTRAYIHARDRVGRVGRVWDALDTFGRVVGRVNAVETQENALAIAASIRGAKLAGKT